ncbi:MAG: hypothetical protein HW421_1706 [Ignavibacteria bacterium]|nr:hypothetical protein [Ignavibacteria bacterium]
MDKNIYEYNFALYNGKVEMNDFLNSLNSQEQAKIISYMDKLVELLNIHEFPNEKLSKYLRDGIFELRVKLKNTTSRSLYFFMSDKNVIFTHGFIKKTEKRQNMKLIKL